MMEDFTNVQLYVPSTGGKKNGTYYTVSSFFFESEGHVGTFRNNRGPPINWGKRSRIEISKIFVLPTIVGPQVGNLVALYQVCTFC